MTPLLFIAADPRECVRWVKHWENATPLALPVHWARSGTWQGRSVIAIANGAGPARAALAVHAAPAPQAICSIGFCGALDPAFTIGDIFTASEVRNGSRSYPARMPGGPPAHSGTLISQNRIAVTAAEKWALHSSGAQAVEMEAAAVAHASEQLNVPFYCVRSVSDLAREDFSNDFNQFLMPDGRFNVLRLVSNALSSPFTRLPELIRLSHRTSIASNSLGEYLARCSF